MNELGQSLIELSNDTKWDLLRELSHNFCDRGWDFYNDVKHNVELNHYALHRAIYDALKKHLKSYNG